MTRDLGPDPPGTAVADHYERWPFPGVVHGSREGVVLVRRLARWLERRPGAPMRRVLDAGCGTGHTTVALARRLPSVEFVGVDVSSAALDAARAQAAAAGLDRIRFVRADVRDLPDSLGTFDGVLALGVLHHVPERDAALAHLLTHLVEGGRMVLWLYGRHGRAAHALNQRLIALLVDGSATDDARIAVAQALLRESGGRFIEGSGVYTPRGSGPEAVEWLLEHPAWLADQMFPAYERPVTLEEIFTLFDAHALEFDHWFGVSADVPRWLEEPELRRRLERLPLRKRLLAIECLLRPPYYLVSGRRPPPRERGVP
jgi:SAM-dependent methyltransferase